MRVQLPSPAFAENAVVAAGKPFDEIVGREHVAAGESQLDLGFLALGRPKLGHEFGQRMALRGGTGRLADGTEAKAGSRKTISEVASDCRPAVGSCGSGAGRRGMRDGRSLAGCRLHDFRRPVAHVLGARGDMKVDLFRRPFLLRLVDARVCETASRIPDRRRDGPASWPDRASGVRSDRGTRSAAPSAAATADADEPPAAEGLSSAGVSSAPDWDDSSVSTSSALGTRNLTPQRGHFAA